MDEVDEDDVDERDERMSIEWLMINLYEHETMYLMWILNYWRYISGHTRME